MPVFDPPYFQKYTKNHVDIEETSAFVCWLSHFLRMVSTHHTATCSNRRRLVQLRPDTVDSCRDRLCIVLEALIDVRMQPLLPSSRGPLPDRAMTLICLLHLVDVSR